MQQSNIYWRHSRSVERAVVAKVASGIRKIDFAGATLSASIQLRPLPLYRVNPAHTIHVAGTIDGKQADIFLPAKVLDLCLDSMSSGLSGAKLDAATAALVLEAVLAEPLDKLEKELGITVTLAKAELCRDASERWSKPDIALRLDMAGSVPAPIYAYVAPEVARKVYAAFMNLAPGESFNPQILLAVRAGVARISPQECAALQPDDILLLDECSLLNKQVCVIADETTGARASVSGTKIKLVEPMQAIAGSWLEPYAAGSSINVQRDQVAVAIDLARRSVSFEDLETIDFNNEIVLPQGIEGAVGLYQGTHRIATGNLVVTGSNLGVRIIGKNVHD